MRQDIVWIYSAIRARASSHGRSGVGVTGAWDGGPTNPGVARQDLGVLAILALHTDMCGLVLQRQSKSGPSGEHLARWREPGIQSRTKGSLTLGLEAPVIMPGIITKWEICSDCRQGCKISKQSRARWHGH